MLGCTVDCSEVETRSFFLDARSCAINERPSIPPDAIRIQSTQSSSFCGFHSNENCHQPQPKNLAFPSWPWPQGDATMELVRQLVAAELSISECQGHVGNAQRGQDSGARWQVSGSFSSTGVLGRVRWHWEPLTGFRGKNCEPHGKPSIGGKNWTPVGCRLQCAQHSQG